MDKGPSVAILAQDPPRRKTKPRERPRLASQEAMSVIPSHLHLHGTLTTYPPASWAWIEAQMLSFCHVYATDPEHIHEAKGMAMDLFSEVKQMRLMMLRDRLSSQQAAALADAHVGIPSGSRPRSRTPQRPHRSV